MAGIVDGSVSDAQVAAFAMAVYFRGMTRDECAALTRAMTRSGAVLDWSGPTWAGRFWTSTRPAASATRSASILAPVVAACGGFVPMISGRGLGPHRRHAGQARQHSRLRDDARPRALPRRRARRRLRDRRPDGGARAGRPAPLRDPRRHRHRRLDPAHHGVDPLEEAGGRARRAGHGRQGRLGRAAAVARGRDRARREPARRRGRGRAPDGRAPHRHEPGARPPRGQRARGRGRRSTS